MDKKKWRACLDTRPEHVAIVGLGGSKIALVAALGNIGAYDLFPDEVWGINYAMQWLRCDKVFFMDGLDFIVESREKWGPAAVLWKQEVAANYDRPIIVGGKTTGIKSAVTYPINDVVEATGNTYFSSTVAYAVAYACYLKHKFDCVKRIDMFGCDFNYESDHEGHQRVSEVNRAGVEFWCGYATAIGIEVVVPAQSTFMNSNEGLHRFYGYDGLPSGRSGGTSASGG